MKLKESQMKELVKRVFLEWKKSSLVTFKISESQAFEKMMEKMREENQKLFDLDQELKKMMDQMEQKGASFDRQKMYGMLKQRLAKEKGIIL